MKLIHVAVLLAAVAAFSIAQNTPPGGTVEGVVIDSVTGAGIGGASVVLRGNQSGKYETTSDVAGHFKITGIAPGNYRTTANKDGFWLPLDLANFLSDPGFRVASGDPVKLELKLNPFNSIRGRVIDPDGKPLAGVEVAVAPNITANEALTDAEGRFELKDTRPGSYILIARPPASDKPGQASEASRTAMVTTYYPSVADKSLAQQIVFGGQPDFGGYEIRMQTAPVYRVRGIVLDEEGKPSPGTELTLVQTSERNPGSMALAARPGASFFGVGIHRAPSGAPEATTIAGSDGRFEFPAVRSGDWRINAVNDSASKPAAHPMRVWAGVIWTICKSTSRSRSI